MWEVLRYPLRRAYAPDSSRVASSSNSQRFPSGGCWILKVKKKAGILARLWEQLCIAAVGEAFEEPDVVGVALSIRAKEDVLSVWLRDSSNALAKIKLGEKMNEILVLGPYTSLEYKNFSTSMKDGSTFRNAKPYVYAALHGVQDGQFPRIIAPKAAPKPTDHASDKKEES